MKNIILLVITILILSCGTDQGEGYTYIYTVKNKSGKSVIVKAYKTRPPSSSIPHITTLKIDKELVKTYKATLISDSYSFISFFQGDSLVIIYNNEKKQIFTINTGGNDRNPFYHDVSTEVTFIFTEQDFENAEDCNGSCE